MVAEGDFREDLYYRLNVIAIQLPPLRERLDDIPLLVQHFLAEICSTTGKTGVLVSPDLMRFFQEYAWPGNVRQLRNCLESMLGRSILSHVGTCVQTGTGVDEHYLSCTRSEHG